MNKIFSWYNQNRRGVLLGIIVFALVITMIQGLNKYYANKHQSMSNSTNQSTTTYKEENYSIVTQKEIDKNTSEDSKRIIKEFFNYCNSGRVEEAYNLISDDCKATLFPTVESFKQKYHQRIFNETKIFDAKLWISNGNTNTYRLEIMSDILATGQEKMPIEEYYTVKTNNGKYSLSISGYIEKENINVSKVQDGLEITVIEKHIYMDYERYKVRIKNNNQSNVIFNTKENVKSIYIEDENELKYIAFLNEITDYDLKIGYGYTKELDIKFNRSYKPNINIEKIVFGNIKIGKNEQLKEIEIDIK